jgi:hypothetical protein
MINNYYLDIFKMDFNTFDYSIKPNPKPVQTFNSSITYQALQTISAHKKYINSVFCPAIKELKERLKIVLKKKYVIFTDDSIEELTNTLNIVMSPQMIKTNLENGKFFTRELDISKYDKSQGYEALVFVCAIMKLLGMRQDVIDYYFKSNLLCKMVCGQFGMSFFINYQMKSGTAPTLIFNTIFTMGANAVIYDDRYVIMAAFCGDDAYYILKMIFKKILESFDSSTFLSQCLNLETKELSCKYIYFCSKFMLLTSTGWQIVPDPVKLLNKLGRNDILDYDHAEEYRVSTCDNFKIKNEETLYLLDLAISERYKIKTSNVNLIFSLLHFIANKENFSKLYYAPRNYVKPHSGYARYDLSRTM